MRALERFLLLQIIDQRWREHLYDMDYLREGIHLRGFAQIEPLVAYKNEAFELFRDLMNSIWGDFARMIFHVEVTVDGPTAARPRRRRGAARARASSSSTGGNRNVTYSGGGSAAGRDGDGRRGGRRRRRGLRRGGAAAAPVEQRRVDETEQIGRNDPCWCGSGKKFKKCHGRRRRRARADRAASAVEGVSAALDCGQMAEGLRVSDQQREQAVEAIRDHFAAGRLTEDELPSASTPRYEAKTEPELERAGLADLPKLPASPQQRKAELVARRSELQRRVIQEAGGGAAAVRACAPAIWAASRRERAASGRSGCCSSC